MLFKTPYNERCAKSEKNLGEIEYTMFDLDPISIEMWNMNEINDTIFNQEH